MSKIKKKLHSVETKHTEPTTINRDETDQSKMRVLLVVAHNLTVFRNEIGRRLLPSDKVEYLHDQYTYIINGEKMVFINASDPGAAKKWRGKGVTGIFLGDKGSFTHEMITAIKSAELVV